MATDPLERVLSDLEGKDAAQRETAVKRLAAQASDDPRILAALERVAANDPNIYPRRAAQHALEARGRTPPPVNPAYANQQVSDSSPGLVNFFLGGASALGVNVVLLPLTTVLGAAVARDELLLITLVLVPIIANLILLALVGRLRPHWLTGALVVLGILLITIAPLWYCVSSAIVLGG